MPLLTREMVGPALAKGATARRGADVKPRFRAGDEVVARNVNTTGHTRVPRYVRGRTGVIDRDHGVFVFPDSNGMEQGEKPQHCYSVRFSGGDLWGPDAPANEAVYVDLWDDHLDPA